jgi:hypothetical protein
MHAVGGSECSRAASTVVVQERINRFATKMRALDLPLPSRVVGPQHERALHRPDKKQRFLIL